jgi:hypothetical protein
LFKAPRTIRRICIERSRVSGARGLIPTVSQLEKK